MNSEQQNLQPIDIKIRTDSSQQIEEPNELKPPEAMVDTHEEDNSPNDTEIKPFMTEQVASARDKLVEPQAFTVEAPPARKSKKLRKKRLTDLPNNSKETAGTSHQRNKSDRETRMIKSIAMKMDKMNQRKAMASPVQQTARQKKELARKKRMEDKQINRKSDDLDNRIE